MVESAPKPFMPILFSLNRYYNVYNVKKCTVKVNFGGKNNNKRVARLFVRIMIDLQGSR